MQRYSKKREAILNCLRSTDTHPTAEWIYEQLKPVYPDLSLATVYRNLGELKKAGLVISMGVVAGHEHFDGNTACHQHAVCASCGKIIDIELKSIDIPLSVIDEVQALTGYTIGKTSVQFSGLCPDCARSADE